MSKRLKIFFYIFIVSFIGVLLFNAWRDDYDWAPIARLICLILLGISLFVYLFTFLFCFIENKKTGKMLDNNEYEKLLSIILKKESKKHLLMPERREYYKYLILNCYLSMSDIEKAREYFNKLDSTQFGIVYYWRACFEFANGEYENIETLKNQFTGSFDYMKYTNRYANLALLLESLLSYSKGNVAKAKERLEKVNRDNISMPTTLKAIKIIEDAVVEEKAEEELSEENIIENKEIEN